MGPRTTITAETLPVAGGENDGRLDTPIAEDLVDGEQFSVRSGHRPGAVPVESFEYLTEAHPRRRVGVHRYRLEVLDRRRDRQERT